MHTVYYTGVTSDIVARAWEHKNNVYPNSFTARYKCTKLVYYCFYPHIEEAIAAEKIIKAQSREYKKQLVYSVNSEWKDLYETVLNE